MIRKEWIHFGLTYFFLSLISLRVKAFLTPNFFNEKLLANHAELLAFTFTNNEQSRLLQFAIPEFLHSVAGMDIPDAYLLQRWAFQFFTFLLFHAFLRKWFSPLVSFAGVLFLAAVIPLTYFNHLQESAPLLSLTFLLALWALRERKDGAFAVILFIGAFNNETILSLTAAYFFVRFRGWEASSFIRLCARTAFITAPAWTVFGIIRFITRDNQHLGDRFTLVDNLQSIAKDLLHHPMDYYWSVYLYPFFLFGTFWVFAFLYMREKDAFLRRISFFIPLFIIAHLITGLIYEARQMLPLAFIIIPLSFMYLQSQSYSACGHKEADGG